MDGAICGMNKITLERERESGLSNECYLDDLLKSRFVRRVDWEFGFDLRERKRLTSVGYYIPVPRDA